MAPPVQSVLWGLPAALGSHCPGSRGGGCGRHPVSASHQAEDPVRPQQLTGRGLGGPGVWGPPPPCPFSGLCWFEDQRGRSGRTQQGRPVGRRPCARSRRKGQRPSPWTCLEREGGRFFPESLRPCSWHVPRLCTHRRPAGLSQPSLGGVVHAQSKGKSGEKPPGLSGVKAAPSSPVPGGTSSRREMGSRYL